MIPKRFMARTLARITNLGEVAQIQGAQVLNDVLIKGEGGLIAVVADGLNGNEPSAVDHAFHLCFEAIVSIIISAIVVSASRY